MKTQVLKMYQVVCDCGWESDTFTFEANAQIAADNHESEHFVNAQMEGWR